MATEKKKIHIELAPTLAEHWYRVGTEYYPSSTTILQAYPQSVQLTRWVAEHGWDEAQRIKGMAGERGTRVHEGIERLLHKETLRAENYSLDEWNRLAAFVSWHQTYKPEIIGTEMMLYSRKYKYAGKADVICRIGGKVMVVDYKTSGTVYDHFALQVASYAQAAEEMKLVKIDMTAILQLGAKNKNNYRYILYPEWRDHFKVFQNVFATWRYDTGYNDPKFEPPVLTLPDSLSL